MALISGTDASAHKKYGNSRITDKAGADRSIPYLTLLSRTDEKTLKHNQRQRTSWTDGKWFLRIRTKTAPTII